MAGKIVVSEILSDASSSNTVKIGTGMTLDLNAQGTTVLPAGSLVGTLPAIDGSALTGVADATKLPLSGGTLTNTLTVQNNVSSNTDPSLALSGTSNLSQDCYLQMAECWTSLPLAMGMDNSANAFKIARNSSGNLDSGVHLKIDSSGRVTMPSQVSFRLSNQGSVQYNATGNGTIHTINYNADHYDIGSNFNTTTYKFTAPVTGKYLMTITQSCNAITNSATTIFFSLRTSNNNYNIFYWYNPSTNDNRAEEQMTGSFICDMDANDTAHTEFTINGMGADTADPTSSTADCVWCGHLLG